MDQMPDRMMTLKKACMLDSRWVLMSGRRCKLLDIGSSSGPYISLEVGLLKKVPSSTLWSHANGRWKNFGTLVPI